MIKLADLFLLLPLVPFRRAAGAVVGVFTLAGSVALQAETVAYWRFETGPANTPVLHATAAGVYDGTTRDISGNGNHLSMWSQGGGAGFAYRADVPFATVPQDGIVNRFSIKNTGGSPASFTAAAASLPTGINADTMTPAQFTVEFYYKPEANGGFRTVLSRDARNVATSNAELAALYLQVRPDDSVGIAFTDVSGRAHSAYSPPGWMYGFNFGSNPEGTGVPWYHLAGVSDGATLKLYVDKVLVATTNLTASGSPDTALAKGTVSGTDWKTGAWAVDRGLYAGGHTDRAYGFIDEVRISNTALHPGQFLATQKAADNCFLDHGEQCRDQAWQWTAGDNLPALAIPQSRRHVRLDPGWDRCVRQSGALHFYASLQHRNPQTFLPGRGRSPGSSRGSPQLAIGGWLRELARRYPGADRLCHAGSGGPIQPVWHLPEAHHRELQCRHPDHRSQL